MSGDREAMIFRPRLGRPTGSSAPVQAREDRALVRAKRRGGLFQRIRHAQAARMVLRSNAVRASARALSHATTGGFSVTAAAQKTTSLGFVGVAAIAAVSAVRLITGEPFEKIAEAANRMLLGDLDDEARAKSDVRKQFSADKDLARIVGQEGKVNSQIASVARDIQRFRMQAERGSSLLRETFATNGTLDMLVLRGRDALMRAWTANGGDAKLEDAAVSYQAGLAILEREGRR